jgi:hypothetical protein
MIQVVKPILRAGYKLVVQPASICICIIEVHTKFGQKPGRKRPRARARMDGWEGNIKMGLKDI